MGASDFFAYLGEAVLSLSILGLVLAFVVGAIARELHSVRNHCKQCQEAYAKHLAEGGETVYSNTERNAQ